jgi:hypothetical protein
VSTRSRLVENSIEFYFRGGENIKNSSAEVSLGRGFRKEEKEGVGSGGCPEDQK